MTSGGAPLPNRAPCLERLSSFDALRRAFVKARRAKRGRGGEPAFYADLEGELLRLSAALRDGSWRPDPYRYFRIRNPKRRLVAEASFADRVVHHALVAELEPPYEARFWPGSFACRRGRGTHAAIGAARRFARRHRYFLRLDVAGYFANIDHRVLRQRLGQDLEPIDEELLGLCSRLMEAAGVPDVPAGQERGLPIGNLTSQFWANVYLDPVDRLAVGRGWNTWLRYMDDMLAFGPDKAALWELAAEVRRFAWERLRLRLKERATQVAPVTEGVPWLGFRVYPGTVRVARDGRRRAGRKLAASRRRLDRCRSPQDEAHEAERAASVVGHLAQGDCLELRRGLLARLGEVTHG